MANSDEHHDGTAGPASHRIASRNQIWNLAPRTAAELLTASAEYVEPMRGEALFEPGDGLAHAYFPMGSAVIAFVLPMRDGRAAEATTIGREGIIAGVAPQTTHLVFTRAIVQIPGVVARVPLTRIDAMRREIPAFGEILTRYADCLIAQILQSVVCASLHSLEERCARWLLMTHDRLQQPEFPLTQESIAEMFGAARTYVTRIASSLQDRGAISYRRGVIRIARRDLLEGAACECYGSVRRHFDAVLPGLYPNAMEP